MGPDFSPGRWDHRHPRRGQEKQRCCGDGLPLQARQQLRAGLGWRATARPRAPGCRGGGVQPCQQNQAAAGQCRWPEPPAAWRFPHSCTQPAPSELMDPGPGPRVRAHSRRPAVAGGRGRSGHAGWGCCPLWAVSVLGLPGSPAVWLQCLLPSWWLMQIYIFIFYFLVLGIELGASPLPGGHRAAELHPSPHADSWWLLGHAPGSCSPIPLLVSRPL